MKVEYPREALWEWMDRAEICGASEVSDRIWSEALLLNLAPPFQGSIDFNRLRGSFFSFVLAFSTFCFRFRFCFCWFCFCCCFCCFCLCFCLCFCFCFRYLLLLSAHLRFSCFCVAFVFLFCFYIYFALFCSSGCLVASCEFLAACVVVFFLKCLFHQ